MELQWPLILFTFFLCLAGGIMVAQGVLTVMGKGKKIQMISLISALVALVIGGLSVFMHLQHWERIFNGFGHITSGITTEFIGCIVFAVMLVLFFLMMRRSEDGMAPKWCGVVAIVVGLALPVVTGMSYLMPALPVWNTPLLPLYYLCNTVLMGALFSLIAAGITGADDVKELGIKLALLGAVAQLIIVVIYAISISSMGGVYSDVSYYFDPTLPDVGMANTDAVVASVMSGGQALAFWLGTVVVGTIAPAALAFFALKIEDLKKVALYAGVALVCAVVGGICWRCILYVVAVSVFALY